MIYSFPDKYNHENIKRGTTSFPAISCGVYGYPEEEADIALAVCMEAAYKDLSIYLYIFRQKMVDIWGETLESVEEH